MGEPASDGTPQQQSKIEVTTRTYDADNKLVTEITTVTVIHDQLADQAYPGFFL